MKGRFPVSKDMALEFAALMAQVLIYFARGESFHYSIVLLFFSKLLSGSVVDLIIF